MKQLSGIFLISAIIFSALPAAFADGETSGDYLTSIGTKAGRGLVNIVTSPMEIPCGIGADMSKRPAVGFFTGVGKGTLLMLRRILVGVTEVGTFMMPAEATIPAVCKEK